MSCCDFCLEKLNRFRSLYTCECKGDNKIYKIHWTCDNKRKSEYKDANCADCGEKFVLCNDGIYSDELISSILTFLCLASIFVCFQYFTVQCIGSSKSSCYFLKTMDSMLLYGTVIAFIMSIVDFVYLLTDSVVYYIVKN